MRGRWEDDCSSYPDVKIKVLTKSVERVVEKYIEEKCLEAGFKERFN